MLILFGAFLITGFPSAAAFCGIILAGYLGANIINKNGKKEETPSINTDKEEDNEEKKED